MKIFKRRSPYLREKADYYRNISLFLLCFFSFCLIVFSLTLPPKWLYLLLFPFLWAVTHFWTRGQNYSKGIRGEESVEQALSNLGDSFFLINDLTFPDKKGNIDHVLIGPPGIFVIEAKNYKGVMTIHSDRWYYGSKKRIKSASYQARRNAQELEKYLIGKDRKIRVKSIVVLTDPYVRFTLSGASSSIILKVDELLPYLKKVEQKFPRFQAKEIEFYTDLILKISPYAIFKEIGEELMTKNKNEPPCSKLRISKHSPPLVGGDEGEGERN